MAGQVLLISGERNAGKTTVCVKAVELAQAAGFSCGGLLTISGEEPHQLTVRNVSTGATRQLTSPQGQVTQGSYRFDPEALRWGAELLVRTARCDLLVIDEMGPLEVEQGQGWAVAIDVLRERRFLLGLAVVRPELINKVQSLLPNVPHRVLTVTVDSRDILPESILALLEQRA